MLMPASPEFVSLCRSQIALLIQGLGAQQSAVYLTENIEESGEAALKPLVLYPDEEQTWPQGIQWQIPALTQPTQPTSSVLALGPSTPIDTPFLSRPKFLKPPPPPKDPSNNLTRIRTNSDLPQQLVLPLMHDNAVLGVLMVSRDGLPWDNWEQSQIDQIAQTLSMACIMDQRAQWLSQSGYQQRALLSDEHHQLSKLLHQFRNPLTALRTLGKLMLKRLQPHDPNRDLAESIVQQSDRLETMLQEFDGTLDLGEAAIEALDQTWSLSPSKNTPALLPSAGIISGAALNLQPCWLVDILDPILGAIAGRLEEKQLTLTRHFTPNLPPIQGDPQALNEVFSNLIDNAIKYNFRGGSIDISLEQHIDPKANPTPLQVLAISDTGPGIPASDLDQIFEDEYRGIQANTDIQGSGLGLAIAQDLIKKMGGTIEAFSPTQSERCSHASKHPGSTFKVSLPATPSQA